MQGLDALPVLPQQWLDEDEALRRGFCAAYFLADTREGLDIGRFAGETLPMLLRQLHRDSRHERITYQGQVRGRVDWPATQKARYQRDVNPALYVCRQPQRCDDTLENQLLKYLLVALAQLVYTLPPHLLAAERWTADGAAEPEWLARRVQTIAHNLRPALAHVRLRQIEPPERITSRHLLKARTSKIELYSVVATLFTQYEQVIIRSRWTAIRPILRQTILLPSPGSEVGDRCIRLAATGFLQAAQRASAESTISARAGP